MSKVAQHCTEIQTIQHISWCLKYIFFPFLTHLTVSLKSLHNPSHETTEMPKIPHLNGTVKNIQGEQTKLYLQKKLMESHGLNL